MTACEGMLNGDEALSAAVPALIPAFISVPLPGSLPAADPIAGIPPDFWLDAWFLTLVLVSMARNEQSTPRREQLKHPWPGSELAALQPSRERRQLSQLVTGFPIIHLRSQDETD